MANDFLFPTIIDVDGIPVEVSKKPIKNMNLRIYPPDGLVKVSAPLSFSERFIRQYLQQKSEWIRGHRERIRKNSSFNEPSFHTGASIEFKGRNYLLIVQEQHGPCHIKIKEELLYCYTSPHSSPGQIQKLLEHWYRREMEALLPDLVRRWEEVVGVKVTFWGIKKMKTRWGSCNTRAHRIWLNLNLIKKPLACLEYVLVHELVHLLEASHNPRFYALMTQFMPQWPQYQSLLEGKKH